jgi:UDP-N-acetylmuramoyl-tripeptide--D-alanyl-D-alanine ligase
MTLPELHALFLTSSGICTDTRKIAENNLFFALSGENFNGNIFAEAALRNGACKAVIDDAELQRGKETFLVENTLKTLQELANFHRKYLNLPVIALTGSNGKTTTKELINTVLSKKYKTTATQGNFNNHIGVPLTLLAMTKDTEIGIVEMGANHLEEIKNLCLIAEPNYGYITNFGKAHLEGFGSEANIVKGKSELYDFIKATGGTLFINEDDKKQDALSKGVDRVTFGKESSCDVILDYAPASPFAEISYKNDRFSSQLTGFYNASNMAAALSMGVYFEVGSNEIKSALAAYKPANNRSQLMEIGQLTVLLDAYNANPTSMEAALINFKGFEAKQKVAILGDMFELGSSAEKEHEEISKLALSHGYDAVLLLGKNFKRTALKANNLYYFENVEDLQHYFPSEVESLLKTKTHVLIKGSRGMALERLVPTLKEFTASKN